MKYIKESIDHINDELCGAKEYAEEYIAAKVKGDNSLANKFKEMSNDELRHAEYIHELTINKIAALQRVYEPPEDMVIEWEHCHKKYVEKTAWIKQMLNM